MNSYRVRIKNTMYGYERDQVVTIEAENRHQAIVKAQALDKYADISIEPNIDEKIDKLQRDVDWIVQYLLNRYDPIQPPTYIPNSSLQHTCPTCGMNWEPIMGYVCSNNNCPMQMKVT